MDKKDEKKLARVFDEASKEDPNWYSGAQAPGWRPAATAPVNTEVLVHVPGANPDVFTAAVTEYGLWKYSCKGERVTFDEFYGDDVFRPTLWSPLPEWPRLAE